MDYSEKLKDPRWQKKRLNILNRDNFTCQKCSDKESTLHVHHKKYFKNKDPWDINDLYLVTLCEHCHEIISNDEFKKEKFDDLKLCKFSIKNTNRIIIFISIRSKIFYQLELNKYNEINSGFHTIDNANILKIIDVLKFSI